MPINHLDRHHAATEKADVAQLVEQRIRNAKVGGSIPLIGTISLGFCVAPLIPKSMQRELVHLMRAPVAYKCTKAR
jgi:hypothetical protein